MNAAPRGHCPDPQWRLTSTLSNPRRRNSLSSPSPSPTSPHRRGLDHRRSVNALATYAPPYHAATDQRRGSNGAATSAAEQERLSWQTAMRAATVTSATTSQQAYTPPHARQPQQPTADEGTSTVQPPKLGRRRSQAVLDPNAPPREKEERPKWRCRECDFDNFSNRKSCKSCNTARPADVVFFTSANAPPLSAAAAAAAGAAAGDPSDAPAAPAAASAPAAVEPAKDAAVPAPAATPVPAATPRPTSRSRSRSKSRSKSRSRSPVKPAAAAVPAPVAVAAPAQQKPSPAPARAASPAKPKTVPALAPRPTAAPLSMTDLEPEPPAPVSGWEDPAEYQWRAGPMPLPAVPPRTSAIPAYIDPWTEPSAFYATIRAPSAKSSPAPTPQRRRSPSPTKSKPAAATAAGPLETTARDLKSALPASSPVPKPTPAPAPATPSGPTRRPSTSTFVAKRLIGAALGKRLTTSADRAEHESKLAAARAANAVRHDPPLPARPIAISGTSAAVSALRVGSAISPPVTPTSPNAPANGGGPLSPPGRALTPPGRTATGGRGAGTAADNWERYGEVASADKHRRSGGW
ncbi:hypothetical protein H9P43_006438 [Blastocladiella emersonii ATCC 22665]|nr:hypothetical protein H9P43_006438 [Blastocladiella emersonii ATCC 22665]